MARKYEQRVRAEQQDETRRRIVEAAVELHGTLGPAATSMSAIAERAGVQRNTLYRYFPDERALSHACSGHYFAVHPFPTTDGWDDLDDPVARARHGLGELYAYFDETQAMTANVIRDAEVHALTREINIRLTAVPMSEIARSLSSAWPHPTPALESVIALALSFATWRTLTRESGLSNSESVELMAGLIAAAADSAVGRAALAATPQG